MLNYFLHMTLWVNFLIHIHLVYLKKSNHNTSQRAVLCYMLCVYKYISKFNFKPFKILYFFILSISSWWHMQIAQEISNGKTGFFIWCTSYKSRENRKSLKRKNVPVFNSFKSKIFKCSQYLNGICLRP